MNLCYPRSMEDMNLFHEDSQQHSLTSHLDESRLFLEENESSSSSRHSKILWWCQKKVRPRKFVARLSRLERRWRNHSRLQAVYAYMPAAFGRMIGYDPEMLTDDLLDIVTTTLVNVASFSLMSLKLPEGPEIFPLCYPNFYASTKFILNSWCFNIFIPIRKCCPPTHSKNLCLILTTITAIWWKFLILRNLFCVLTRDVVFIFNSSLN